MLIYFDRDSKQVVINNLLSALAVGGYLVVGPSEGIYDMLDPLQKISPLLYQKVDDDSTTRLGRRQGRCATMTDNSENSGHLADDMAEYLQTFLDETEEQLDDLVETMLALERDSTNRKT